MNTSEVPIGYPTTSFSGLNMALHSTVTIVNALRPETGIKSILREIKEYLNKFSYVKIYIEHKPHLIFIFENIHNQSCLYCLYFYSN